MHNKLLSTIVLAATLSVATVPVSAGIVAYTDPTSYAAALSAAGATAGSTLVLGSNVAGLFQSSYTADGLTFTGNPYIFGSGTSDPLYNDYYLFGKGQYTVTIPGGMNVYGLSLYESCSANCATYPNVITATSTTQTTPLTISNSPITWSSTLGFGVGQLVYFGFVSTDPITSITISSQSGQVPNMTIGDITLATGSGSSGGATPESTTLVLIGAGLAFMARCRRLLSLV